MRKPFVAPCLREEATLAVLTLGVGAISGGPNGPRN